MTSITLRVTGARACASVTGPLTSGMVGVPVTIEYDEAWNGLIKNLVCRCSPGGPDSGESRVILNVRDTATVAYEVMKPDMHLYLGIEGFNENGKLVVPTTWALCGRIQHGANADGEFAADPELPVWNQLQAQIEQIKQDGITQEQATNIHASVQAAQRAAEAAADLLQNASIYIGPDEPVGDNRPLYWLDTGADVALAVTLMGISAAYSGGSVPVGTAVSALTGVAVTAHYSDGSSKAVTGYTLSGAISEGSNTVTVSYKGMTATFAVTGVAESGGEEPGVVTYTITNNLANVTSSNAATSVQANTGYTATLTAAEGYEIGTVKVTMGGTDITSTAYADGVVSIGTVTGNVVIAATATAESTESNIYNLADISVETTEDRNAGGSLKTGYTRYKIEGVRAGDIVRLAGTNGDNTLCWYDGTNSHGLNDTTMFTKEFMNNYNWCQYTWIADANYDYLYFASMVSMLDTRPNSAATIEKAVN